MTGNLPETRRELRKTFLHYGLSGILFLLSVSGAIVIRKYTESLAVTLDRLQEFNIQYIKVRNAIDDMTGSVRMIKEYMPRDRTDQSVQERLLCALDDLKSKAGGAEITIANIEDKEDDVQLPLSIKGPLKDYTRLVNYTGYLQSLKFPFFAVTNVNIWRDGDDVAGNALFEIKGILKFPKSSSQMKRPFVKDKGNKS